METTTRSTKPAKVLSVIVIVVGAVMLIMGCVVYGIVSSQLSAQGITVSAVTKDDPGPMAGKPVNGPFEALAQVNAIQYHLNAETGGKTFAQLGNVATDDGQTYNANVTAANSTDGQTHSAGDPLSAQDKATYEARQSAQTASFLEASLFLSVLAFGVSVFIAVMGVVIAVIGVNLYLFTKQLVVVPQAVPAAKV